MIGRGLLVAGLGQALMEDLCFRGSGFLAYV